MDSINRFCVLFGRQELVKGNWTAEVKGKFNFQRSLFSTFVCLFVCLFFVVVVFIH